MAGAVRRLLTTLVARIDQVADRDPNSEALSGRLSSRRNGRSVVPPTAPVVPPTAPAGPPTAPAGPPTPPSGPLESTPGRRPRRAVADRTPEQAQQALDQIRADQHRRMRARRWPGSGDKGD